MPASASRMPGEAVQQRGLAGAGRAHDGERLPVGEVDVDPGERGGRAEALDQAAGGQSWGGGVHAAQGRRSATGARRVGPRACVLRAGRAPAGGPASDRRMTRSQTTSAPRRARRPPRPRPTPTSGRPAAAADRAARCRRRAAAATRARRAPTPTTNATDGRGTTHLRRQPDRDRGERDGGERVDRRQPDEAQRTSAPATRRGSGGEVGCRGRRTAATRLTTPIADQHRRAEPAHQPACASTHPADRASRRPPRPPRTAGRPSRSRTPPRPPPARRRTSPLRSSRTPTGPTGIATDSPASTPRTNAEDMRPGCPTTRYSVRRALRKSAVRLR